MSWSELGYRLVRSGAAMAVIATVLLISNHVNAFDGCPANSHEAWTESVGGNTRVHCQCNPGFDNVGGKCTASPGGGTKTGAGGTQGSLADAEVIRAAMARREKPPFEPLWNYYQHNRPIAQGLLPDGNRCALVLSMALGLEPRPGELTLQELGDKGLRATLIDQIRRGPGAPVRNSTVTDTELAKRYYVQAEQLADRLKDEWKTPTEFSPEEARRALLGRRGVVFLEHAYPSASSLGLLRTGDHIGLWDKDHLADPATTPFEKADRVLFWEFP